MKSLEVGVDGVMIAVSDAPSVQRSKSKVPRDIFCSDAKQGVYGKFKSSMI